MSFPPPSAPPPGGPPISQPPQRQPYQAPGQPPPPPPSSTANNFHSPSTLQPPSLSSTVPPTGGPPVSQHPPKMPPTSTMPPPTGMQPPPLSQPPLSNGGSTSGSGGQQPSVPLVAPPPMGTTAPSTLQPPPLSGSQPAAQSTSQGASRPQTSSGPPQRTRQPSTTSSTSSHPMIPPPLSQPHHLSQPPAFQPPAMSQPPAISQPPPLSQPPPISQPPVSQPPRPSVGPPPTGPPISSPAMSSASAAQQPPPTHPMQPPQAVRGGYPQPSVSSSLPPPPLFPQQPGQPQPPPGQPGPGAPGDQQQQVGPGGRRMSASVHPALASQGGATRADNPSNILGARQILPAAPARPPRAAALSDSQRRANCSPKFMRMTLAAMPETSSLLSQCRLPLALHLNPFSEEVPVISGMPIVRCRSCRTYLNPFISFLSQGSRWRCNLCQYVNDIPQDFFYDRVKGKLVDRTERPDLNTASVEYIAPSDYMVRPPQPCSYAFCIDVSSPAVMSGMVQVVCKALLDALDHLTGDERTRIAIITFDNTVHFHNLNDQLAQPQKLVMTDIDDPFLPHSMEDLLVSLKDSKELVRSLLETIPTMHARPLSSDACTGAVLKAARLLMGGIGGCISVFQTARPSIGPGIIPEPVNPNPIGSSKEQEALNPVTGFYKEFAVEASRCQIAVDMLLFGPGHHGIATLGQACQFGGGTLLHFPTFTQHSEAEVDKVRRDMRHFLTRPLGMEAVLRVRTSKGINLDNFHGHFFVRAQDLLALANVSPDNAYTVQLKIDDKQAQPVAFLQSALLYTSSDGTRRIRVHTLALPVVRDYQSIFAHADQVAIVSLLAKLGVDRARGQKTSDARLAMHNFLVDVIKAYRKHCASNFPSGQLVLPEQLKLLPIYIHALMRHEAFTAGNGVNLDVRCAAMMKLKTIPMKFFMDYVYPRMYSLHDMGERVGLKDERSRLPMPVLLHLSSEKLSKGGLYLLVDSERLYLFIKSDATPTLLQEAFGVPDISQLNMDMTAIPQTDSTLNEKIRNIVAGLQNLYPFHIPITIVPEAARTRDKFLRFMFDDRAPSSLSYYEFLSAIHAEASR